MLSKCVVSLPVFERFSLDVQNWFTLYYYRCICIKNVITMIIFLVIAIVKLYSVCTIYDKFISSTKLLTQNV